MTRRTNQVLIIGGGVIGVSCMYYLAHRGWDVVLIEKDQIGAGCSYGNGGLLVPGHSIPLAQPGVIAKGLRWLFNDESPFHIKFRLSPALTSWLIRFRLASTFEGAVQWQDSSDIYSFVETIDLLVTREDAVIPTDKLRCKGASRSCSLNAA